MNRKGRSCCNLQPRCQRSAVQQVPIFNGRCSESMAIDIPLTHADSVSQMPPAFDCPADMQPGLPKQRCMRHCSSLTRPHLMGTAGKQQPEMRERLDYCCPGLAASGAISLELALCSAYSSSWWDVFPPAIEAYAAGCRSG